jgi:MoaA/NifB/PqqE/SkfB family radical SAM enzyme
MDAPYRPPPPSLPAVGVRALKRLLPVARFGVQRLRNEKTPFQMTFSLTNKCNFRCEYCHIPLQKRDEMTTAEWKAAIDEFVAGGMGRASLIGGEPLLRKDAGKLIQHLKSRGVHTAMNTNGWFVREKIDDVKHLDLACITLDGPKELHDRQRHEGSYDRVLDAIELLKHHGVPVVTMTVVTPSGAENVGHVLEVAARFGHKAFFQLEHDAGCDVELPIAPHLTDRHIARLADDLLARKTSGEPVGNSKTILEMQKRDGRRIGGDCSHCFAGRYYGYVLSDGTVAPCLLTQWQQERGNGRKNGFLRAYHEMAAPRGPGCGCVPIHEVNNILAFDVRVLFDALDMTIGPHLRRLAPA